MKNSWGLRRLFVVLLAVIVLFGAFLYLYAGWIVQTKALPWLEEKAKDFLEADVKIGAVSLSGFDLLVEDLLIEKKGKYRLAVPQAELNTLSLSAVQGQFSDIRLVSPELSIVVGPKETAEKLAEEQPDAGFTMPVFVEQLVVENGEFSYRDGEQEYIVAELSGEAHIANPISFRASAKVGRKNGVFVPVKGSGEWGDRIHFKFDRVEWREENIIRKPLDIVFPEEGGVQFQGGIAFQELDSEGLKQLLSAAGYEWELPSAWQVKLTSPAFTIDFGKIAGDNNAWEVHGSIDGNGGSFPQGSTGRVELQAKVRGGAGGLSEIELEKLLLEGIEYMSADEQKAFSGGRLRANGKLIMGEEGELFEIESQAELGVAEVLYDTFYADLKERQGKLSFVGSFDQVAKTVRAKKFSFAVKQLGSIKFSGLLAADRLNITGTAEFPDLREIASSEITESIAETLPTVAGGEFAGSLGAEFQLKRGQRGTRFVGEIRTKDLKISLPASELTLLGVSGKLPLQYSSEGDEAGKGRGRKQDTVQDGAFSLTEFKIGSVALKNRALQIRSSLNRLELLPPLFLEVGGGEASIKNVMAMIVNGKPQLSARVGLHKIDLHELTRDVSDFPLSGMVNGQLGKIIYQDGSILSDGETRINIFDGEIRVKNIRVADALSPYRTVGADVHFQGINLREVTRTFSFGEMNGIVDGNVSGLRLFGFTPSAFNAELSTRSKGKRNISVKAIKNLTILSQGGGIPLLTQGVYKFISFYRFKKLGIKCRLENDIFQVFGSALSGSDEHLIYGGLIPPKINVVIANHAISFKEMLKRLSRVDRTAEKE